MIVHKSPTSHCPNGSINYLSARVWKKMSSPGKLELSGGAGEWISFSFHFSVDYLKNSSYLVYLDICRKLKGLKGKRENADAFKAINKFIVKTNLWQTSSDCELCRLKLRQRIISSVVLCLRKPRAMRISSVVLDCRLIAWGRETHSMGWFGMRPGLGSL